ncbi:DUF1995 family protein [Leptolyngbya sp. NIES-2104]|uniref:DUF1995 family protein n=1 Tax=Leptolyngbya sp. NIES-2104 TaxID=1552121 RepID=UPI0006EC6899|nr:DUF1995 family protein [Leptolyngbya sp. NIES-2104]GAP96080.1 hypothetical protein NIES2104_26140 [Leptolyngbya sp. NIES-2104]
MPELPNTLDDAIAQAQSATQAALAAGYTRLQVELVFPELKAMPIAQKFISTFHDRGAGLKLFFTDSGIAALAKRDWGEIPHPIRSLDVAGSRQTTPVEEQVDPEDEIYVFVAPSSVEVSPVEQICSVVGERPVILLNPRLEDVATIGIGYAGRQLRQRFLDTIEPCYYLRPLDDQSAVLRCYPAPWQVWYAPDGEYQLIAEEQERPDSERLDEIFAGVLGQSAKPGLFAGFQQFLKALGR